MFVPVALAAETIQIKGSDSEVNLVQRLAEVYMEGHPGTRIAVTGGGSGTGIAALIDGTAHIANSSRDLSGQEKIAARRKGRDPRGFVFATDGIAVIVNAANRVESLGLDALGAFFRGEVSTWEGGTPVTLYGRQSNSGTYDFFKKVAVKGEYTPRLRQMNGNAQIVEAVRGDPGGIGYVAAGYLSGENGRGVRAVPIAVDEKAISPLDEAAVLSGAYPLARPLYQFVDGKPTGAVRDFLAWEAGPEGQRIVKETGFYPIAPAYSGENAALLASVE